VVGLAPERYYKSGAGAKAVGPVQNRHGVLMMAERLAAELS
jgi:hypothetical protein